MTSQRWTIREVLAWAARDFERRGIESARLDAELLVAEALGIDRIGLYLDLNRPLLEQERAAIRPMLTRRRAREPVAYILGRKDFYGRRFRVTSDVLIPRPDTETLVEHALARIPPDRAARVIDVGTGSGAIAVTIAAERPLAQVTATDISEAALRVAADNAALHGVSDRVRFELANLVGESQPYDILVSNPPYIPSSGLEALQAEVSKHEPKVALDGGPGGLDVIEALLIAAEPAAARQAEILIEVGLGQAREVVSFAAARTRWQPVAIYPDLQRVDRVVHLRRI